MNKSKVEAPATQSTGNMAKMPMSPAPIPEGFNAAISVTNAPVKEFTVTGQNFSFTPNTLTVNKGDLVKINFQNAGGFHDFRLDDFKVATSQIKTGETGSVSFIADKTGTFEYYCSVGQHRAMGMKGTLTVK
ncbi:MAG: cupredoxin domain-containing protein [Patescibacteria group bacterium]